MFFIHHIPKTLILYLFLNIFSAVIQLIRSNKTKDFGKKKNLSKSTSSRRTDPTICKNISDIKQQHGGF